MTQQQSDDDLVASFAHTLKQKARDTQKWQTLANEREETIKAIRDLLSADSSTRAGQTLVEAVRTVLAERDALRAAHQAREGER